MLQKRRVAVAGLSMLALVGAVSAASAQETQQAIADPSELTLQQIMGPKDADLEDFKWVQRPVIVFADSENDPRFAQQIALLEAGAADLAVRDVVVLTDTDPAALGPLRKKLRPRGFMLVLIGKDGGVKLRKPLPWDVRELGRVIDKMPMRQREIRERRGSDGS